MTAVFLAHLLFCLINSDFGTSASEQTQRRVQDSDVFESSVDPFSDSSSQDVVSVHMFRLYDKYNRELNRPTDGNTVRSFKASPVMSVQKVLYQFNFSSIQESEVVLATTFHFIFDKRPHQRSWPCKRFRNPSCRLQPLHQQPPVHLLFRSGSSNMNDGVLLGNVTLLPHRKGTWQFKDVTRVMREARRKGELVITAEFDFGKKPSRFHGQLSLPGLPYMLVYANDFSISEPNSVAATLQRYDFSAAAQDPTQSPNSSPGTRFKRETYFPDPIQNNELPEVEYNTVKNHELWESAYLALKPKHSSKERRRKGQESGDGLRKSQLLNFDEKTMKKARRRQWTEPRVCSRRYLKVDFADIGWSEWILSPKSFDAYYCAGTCEFPMPKTVRPSNHATIQSIVKAVGIVPQVPEPCCVPDKMNTLSVLFLDESKNVVLKIYPNMSVDTCACR